MNSKSLSCAIGLNGETLSAWRDRLVPEDDARRIELHVIDCAACQQRLAQFARIATDVQQQPVPDLRRQTWRGIQARLAQKEPHPMRIQRAAAFSSIAAVALLTLIIFLAVLVFHQRPGGSTGPATATSSTTATPGVTATVTSGATATTTAASCASALLGAGPASAGPSFADLPLPSNSVSTAPTQTGGGGAGQFTLYIVQMCTSNSSAAAVNAFFNGITTHGWLHSDTFPADGSFQSNCTNSSCWAKDVRYVSLQEPITDLGGGVERYSLTIATAPPAPDCSGSGSTFSNGYYYKLPDPHYTTTQVYANIPLPPLSRIVPDDAAGGQRGYGICSAGTVASITAFMNAQLTKLGWSSAGNGTWTKDGYSLTVSIPTATNWLIGWHDPDLHF